MWDEGFVWELIEDVHERELDDREAVNDACLRTVRITILFLGALLPGLRYAGVAPNAAIWSGTLAIGSIATGFLAYTVGERYTGMESTGLTYLHWTAELGMHAVVERDTIDSYARYVHRNSRGTDLIAAVLALAHLLLVVGILLVGVGLYQALGDEAMAGTANTSAAATLLLVAPFISTRKRFPRCDRG